MLQAAAPWGFALLWEELQAALPGEFGNFITAQPEKLHRSLIFSAAENP